MTFTPNLWFELVSKGDEVIVSLVEDIERTRLFDLFIKEPFKEFKYTEWKNVSLDKDEFKREVINNTKKLLHFIEVLNPQILKSKSIEGLVLLIKKATTTIS